MQSIEVSEPIDDFPEGYEFIEFICKEKRVYKATKNGIVFAIKQNKKGPNYNITELNILKKLQSKYFIKLLDYIIVKDTISLVFDYWPINMNQYIETNGSIPKRTTIKWASQIISAMKDLHNEKIIHRDLYADNILLTNNSQNSEVRIIDFHFSIDDSRTPTTVVKKDLSSYHPPDIF